jgi:CheY-like chemotaxis protein
LRSRQGRGTVFTLELPAACAPALEARPAEEVLPPVGFDGRLILVIDDDESVREGMRTLLGGWGAEVIACAGMSDTLAGIAKLGRAPDIIIADHQLQEGMVGADAILAVRGHFGKPVPAIIITGSTSQLLTGAAQALGCQLLLKPVMPAKLRSLLNAALQA